MSVGAPPLSAAPLPFAPQVMITSHSWGETVVRNFFWWVERKEQGWTEKHVAAYVNIAGTVLGVPKVRPLERLACKRAPPDAHAIMHLSALDALQRGCMVSERA